MSRSLSIECDWLDQPAAADPVERRTWAGLRIRVAGRFASRLWDREAASERQTLYIPAFPLAQWLIANCWSVLFEPNVADDVPPSGANASATQRDWLVRHCLRAADAGLMLPRLCLFGSGRGVCAQWTADEPDAYPNMPGSFVSADWVHLDTVEAEHGLREFVTEVLSQVADMSDPRVARARANWEAISRAEDGERFFCRAAGMMGLDPYASEDCRPGLLSLLETGLGDDPDKPLVQDFLEAGTGETAEAQWQWTTNAEKSLVLRSAPQEVSRRLAIPDQYRPAKTGCAAARGVREKSGISPVEPVGSLSDVSQALKLGSLAFVEVNHLPSRRVQAVVGWRADHTPVVAGPVPSRDTSRRFLEARGLYHAIYACDRGVRLATSAHTWDQQASRAFAAELLAPQAALLDAATHSSEDSEALVSTLSNRYRVSTQVIGYQLENAGVGGMA